MITTLRIATRKSPLALWQARYVKDYLQKSYPHIEIEFLEIVTTADKMQLTPLNKIGGKGLFVKELEQAILDGQADLAVHSIKDMPAELQQGLQLSAICQREDPHDAFISNQYPTLDALPAGSIIGTSSLRRQAQVLALRPDLKVRPLRGNVETRLQKLDQGEFAAIILAAAGLKRLQLQNRITAYFSVEQMLPAAGQGAIGIESRVNDPGIQKFLQGLDDYTTRQEILAERAFVLPLGGSCQFPIAAHAVCQKGTLTFKGLVSDITGREMLRIEKKGPMEFAQEIATTAVNDLIAAGALALLEKVVNHKKLESDANP